MLKAKYINCILSIYHHIYYHIYWIYNTYIFGKIWYNQILCWVGKRNLKHWSIFIHTFTNHEFTTVAESWFRWNVEIRKDSDRRVDVSPGLKQEMSRAVTAPLFCCSDLLNGKDSNEFTDIITRNQIGAMFVKSNEWSKCVKSAVFLVCVARIANTRAFMKTGGDEILKFN